MKASKENTTFCFFNTSKDWGGGEKWHFEMARHLHQEGFRVMLCPYPGSELYKKALAHSLPVHPFKINNLSFLKPLLIRQLKNFLVKKNITHIILNLPSDLKTAGRAAKKASVRKIIYRRGSAKPIKNSLSNRHLFKKTVDLIIANSEKTKNTILQNNPGLFPNEKIKVLYNGIDTEAYEKSIKKRNQGVFVIGTAGRLSKEKGHLRLIEVAKLLKERGLNFTLRIAGKGPEEGKLRDQVINEGLKDCVRFAGFVEPFTLFLKGIDVFVLPSYYEGFGYVLIEAMAAEKPVLSFDIGATDEIISNEENGYIIPDNNIEMMAEKLINLADNPNLQNAFGEKGKQIVRERFSFKKMTERFLDIMNS